MEYLRENGIDSMTGLLGKAVFFPYPAQGIRKKSIRKIECHYKSMEWSFVCDSSYKVNELGVTIFFTEHEAHNYQIEKLNQYTKQQQERIMRNNYERKVKDIAELNRLLKKYPDEESRSLTEESYD